MENKSTRTIACLKVRSRSSGKAELKEESNAPVDAALAGLT